MRHIMTRTNAQFFCRIVYIIVVILSSSASAQEPMPGKSDGESTPPRVQGQVFLSFCLMNETDATIGYNLRWGNSSWPDVIPPGRVVGRFQTFNNDSEAEAFIRQNGQPIIEYDNDISPVDFNSVSISAEAFLKRNTICESPVPKYRFMYAEPTHRFIAIVMEY